MFHSNLLQELQHQQERREQLFLQQSLELQDLEKLMEHRRQKQLLQSHAVREGVFRSLAMTNEKIQLLFAWSHWCSIMRQGARAQVWFTKI